MSEHRDNDYFSIFSSGMDMALWRVVAAGGLASKPSRISDGLTGGTICVRNIKTMANFQSSQIAWIGLYREWRQQVAWPSNQVGFLMP